MTRHQLKGETEAQHEARVAKEIDRGYRIGTYKSYRWKRVRDKFLKEHKLDEPGDWWICTHCQRWTDAPEVDHIIKRSVRPDLVLQPTNLQILCHNCHAVKDNGMKFK